MQGFAEIRVKPCKMIGKTDKTPQLNMYQVPLVQFINKQHELCQLAEKINWDELEKDYLFITVLIMEGHPYQSVR